MSLRCLLQVPLSPYSGYGNDGIGIARALVEAGVDVYLQPTHVSPPLPSLVAGLLTKRLQAPFDLLIHHVDPGQLGLSPEARRSATTTVAWTMWEYSSLDNLKSRSTLRKRLRDYDLVVGYDQVSADGLSPYLTKSTAAAVVQGGFWPGEWPQRSRDWTSPRFGFCMEGALHERKDPFVAIQAFKELKDEYPEEFEPAELHLKTNSPGLHEKLGEWVPKLRVHYSVWPQEVLADFYAAQHVLLAPSRGEGKNMPALQFMSTGGAVVATYWGGHGQWLSPQYAYPLDFQLRPVSPTLPNCLSARASKEHLKTLMLHVFRNRAEVAAKGNLAAQVIPAMCNWSTVLDRLFLRLGELLPVHGPALHAAYAAQARPVAEPAYV